MPVIAKILKAAKQPHIIPKVFPPVPPRHDQAVGKESGVLFFT
jgi:hypothetical protein